MPRQRARPLFELADQYIARDPASPLLYRFWRERGRTRRQSLGTDDLALASRRLAEIVVRGAPATESTPLSIVLLKYCDEHGDKTETGPTARWTARIYLECWGAKTTVAAIDEPAQKRFAEWCAGQDMAISTICRCQEILRAALRYSNLQTKVICNAKHLRDAWRIKAKPIRRVFIPTDAEMQRLWKQPMPENLRRWLLISMCTGCRPSAALDLSPAARDREHRLIDLLPADRSQNKKVRPKVRCPAVLTKALDTWERAGLQEYGNRYVGYSSYFGVRDALERACAADKANLPLMTSSTYSIRHKVATVLRSAGVPADQISMQLGHRRPEDRVTSGYGSYAPDFLKAVSDALNVWVKRITGPVKSQHNPKSNNSKRDQARPQIGKRVNSAS